MGKFAAADDDNVDVDVIPAFLTMDLSCFGWDCCNCDDVHHWGSKPQSALEYWNVIMVIVIAIIIAIVISIIIMIIINIMNNVSSMM